MTRYTLLLSLLLPAIASAAVDEEYSSYDFKVDVVPTISIRAESTDAWDFSFAGPSIGWVNASSGPTQMGRSLEIGWFQMIGVGYRLSRFTRFSVGLGLNWRNYRMSGAEGLYWSADRQGNARLEAYPADVTPKYSRLKTFSLTVPVMWKQQMPFRLCGTRQWVALGAECMFTTHASVLARWTDADGNNHKLSQGDVAHRSFTANAVAILGIANGVGIYFRWSPMKPLAAPAPQFSTLSTGFLIGF